MFSLTNSLRQMAAGSSFLGARLLSGASRTVYEPLAKKRGGQNVTQYLHKQLLQKHDPTGRRTALVSGPERLRAGDIIKVSYLDQTSVLGRVLGIKRGQYNLGTNILIRNRITKLGCEMRIPLYSPNIKNIELVQKPARYLPRAKHYYIRNNKYDVGDLEMLLRKQKKTADA